MAEGKEITWQGNKHQWVIDRVIRDEECKYTVLRAFKQKRDGQEVALKIYFTKSSRDPAQLKVHRQIFMRELNVYKESDHPNICKYFDHGIHLDANFISVELAGYSIVEHLKDFRQQRLLDEIKVFFRQLLDVLVYLHGKNVAHCDIKPDNLLIGKDGKLKLVDFCLAKSVNPDVMIHSLEIYGTRPYMAPEIFQLLEHFPTECDIWSAGAVLVQIVTGFKWAIPFHKDANFKKLMRRDVEEEPWSLMQPDMRELALKMLNPEAEFRPTAEEARNCSWLKE